ncbi:hypothetical protein RJG79_10665 [Mycoplasmatota bacterium WC44]
MYYIEVRMENNEKKYVEVISNTDWGLSKKKVSLFSSKEDANIVMENIIYFIDYIEIVIKELP